MQSRNLIITWALLLIAALAIGGLALYLLGGERSNLASAAADAQRQRLAAVAETLNLTVSDSREALASTLHELQRQGLVDTLELWRLDNPLVRNVFLWVPDDGLAFPDPDRPTSDEERSFIRRYAGLFNGQTTWTGPPVETTQVSEPVQARRELTELAKSLPAAASAPQLADKAKSQPVATGWLSWFWEDGLHILVWAENSEKERFGIELEMAALLSRLVTVLPAPQIDRETWALLDDRGRVVHQRGQTDLSGNPLPTMSLPVGASLPHWQVGLYSDGVVVPTGQSFLLLGGLLTMILVVAILLGGSLLLWQARRSLLDARRKTGFVSNVSHELKTPLTTIRMYAEMLEESDEMVPERRRRYLDVISNEARRLTRLVNNLLDFSRLEQGRKQYHRQQVNLNELLDRALSSHALLQANSEMALMLNLPEQQVTVNSDADAVEQALLNLVDNALKYASDGKELTVTLSSGQHMATIKVTDRGPGIPASHSERIFDTFHRGDNSLTTRRQGCGLGLSIARQLMRDLGGDLHFQPSESGGSCFSILLPTSQEPGE